MTAKRKCFRLQVEYYRYFKTLRPIPLTPHEETLYQDFFLRRDTLARKKKPVNKNLEFWGELGTTLAPSSFRLGQRSTHLGAIAYGAELCYLGAIRYGAEQRVQK